MIISRSRNSLLNFNPRLPCGGRREGVKREIPVESGGELVELVSGEAVSLGGMVNNFRVRHGVLSFPARRACRG